MSAAGPQPLAGVLGWPVAHSRSPAMHAAAFRALGLDWRYLRLPVRPELLGATASALPASGYRGVNVTIPHKLSALTLADAATPTAAAIGAANTLTFSEGAIEADNTDAPGFLAALGEPVAGSRALVLGAGGAARAVVWALRDARAAEVMVWNRDRERARRLARELDADHVERPRSADLMVNTTSVGLDPSTSEREALDSLALDGVEPPGVFVDLAYGAHETPLCRWAARSGARVVDGLEVLVRQGALSFERWTGRGAPLDVMREAVRASGVG